MIDTSTGAIVTTVPMGGNSYGVAITPNGKFVYVTINTTNGLVSVIDTSTNTIVNTLAVGENPTQLAITPDGKFAYVTNLYSNTVSVIDTSTNTVVDTVALAGESPDGVAITPNGRFAYVTYFDSSIVSVIDTRTNAVVNTVTLPNGSSGLAITPNGQLAYISNWENEVPVLDTITNTVLSTVFVGGFPNYVAITPAVPFSAFRAELEIFRGARYGFDMTFTFTLGSGSSELKPGVEAMTLQIAGYTLSLPAGSFHPLGTGANPPYVYKGEVNGAHLRLRIDPLGNNTYAFDAAGSPVAFPGVTSAARISLFFGNDSGTTLVKPLFSRLSVRAYGVVVAPRRSSRTVD